MVRYNSAFQKNWGKSPNPQGLALLFEGGSEKLNVEGTIKKFCAEEWKFGKEDIVYKG